MSKSARMRIRFSVLVAFGCIIYFIFCLGYELYQVHNLKVEEHNLKAEYKKIKKEQEELKIKIEQLNDPEYLAKYARENYSYSKDGEYIIKLKEKDEEISKVKKKIDDNYMIIGISAFMFIVIVFALKKSKKRNKGKR